MHRPLSALDVGPKVSSALRVLPHRTTEPTKNNSVPCPKSRTTEGFILTTTLLKKLTPESYQLYS